MIGTVDTPPMEKSATKVIKVTPEEVANRMRSSKDPMKSAAIYDPPDYGKKTKNPYEQRLFIARQMANKGLPWIFTLFSLGYFIGGMLVYNGVIYYDYEFNTSK